MGDFAPPRGNAPIWVHVMFWSMVVFAALLAILTWPYDRIRRWLA